jgi:hypothetical protein
MALYQDETFASELDLADFKQEVLNDVAAAKAPQPEAAMAPEDAVASAGSDQAVPPPAAPAIDAAAAQAGLEQNYDVAAQTVTDADPNPGGETLFQRVKDIVCGELQNIADGSDSSTFDTILSAVESVMPGGVLVKILIKAAVELILKVGVGELCGAAAAAPAAPAAPDSPATPSAPAATT